MRAFLFVALISVVPGVNSHAWAADQDQEDPVIHILANALSKASGGAFDMRRYAGSSIERFCAAYGEFYAAHSMADSLIFNGFLDPDDARVREVWGVLISVQNEELQDVSSDCLYQSESLRKDRWNLGLTAATSARLKLIYARLVLHLLYHGTGPSYETTYEEVLEELRKTDVEKAIEILEGRLRAVNESDLSDEEFEHFGGISKAEARRRITEEMNEIHEWVADQAEGESGRDWWPFW